MVSRGKSKSPIAIGARRKTGESRDSQQGVKLFLKGQPVIVGTDTFSDVNCISAKDAKKFRLGTHHNECWTPVPLPGTGAQHWWSFRVSAHSGNMSGTAHNFVAGVCRLSGTQTPYVTPIFWNKQISPWLFGPHHVMDSLTQKPPPSPHIILREETSEEVFLSTVPKPVTPSGEKPPSPYLGQESHNFSIKGQTLLDPEYQSEKWKSIDW